MPIDTTTIIHDYKGNAVKTGRLPDGRPDPASDDLTVRDAVFEALNVFLEGEKPSPAESAKRYRITQLFFGPDEELAELKPKDRIYIKERAGKVLTPLVFGRLCDVLDEAEKTAKATTNGKGDVDIEDLVDADLDPDLAEVD